MGHRGYSGILRNNSWDDMAAQARRHSMMVEKTKLVHSLFRDDNGLWRVLGVSQELQPANTQAIMVHFTLPGGSQGE